MKQILKRSLALVLALAMSISLSSCGSKQEKEENPENVVNEATTGEEVKNEAAEGAKVEMVEETKAVELFDDDNIQPLEADTVKNEDGSISYTLRTKRYSHWVMKENGALDQVSPTKINAEDKWYSLDKQFSSSDTAFIVMDPWIDWADDYLNEYFGAVTQEKTLPLMQAAAASGHQIIILTNDPSRVTYNTKIDPGLQELVDQGKAKLLYHTDYPTRDDFVKLLDELGIKNLIYTGYASNMCVLFRELGIARMATSGKAIYFVPECSAAMEHADTWETQEVHNATSVVIGQTQALLIDFDDIMNAINK